MPVTLSDELLHSAKLTGLELKREIALVLFMCAPILGDMIREAGFCIGDDLHGRFLRSLGEIP